jgi:hypothetical protein
LFFAPFFIFAVSSFFAAATSPSFPRRLTPVAFGSPHLTAFFADVQVRRIADDVKNRRRLRRDAATIGKRGAVCATFSFSPFRSSDAIRLSSLFRVLFSAFSSKLKRKEKSRLFYFAASSL